MDTSKPQLIVFEGLDRSGKTTQAKNLVNYMNNTGSKAVYMSYPNRSSPITGALLNNYLKGNFEMSTEVSHLIFCANRYETMTEISNLMKEGYNVIVDRYSCSGICYSIAKGDESIKEWAIGCEKRLLEPDILIYIDTPIDYVSTRSNFGDEIYEKKSFQERVRENYKHLLKDTAILFPNTKTHTIDGSGSIEDVFSSILAIL